MSVTDKEPGRLRNWVANNADTGLMTTLPALALSIVVSANMRNAGTKNGWAIVGGLVALAVAYGLLSAILAEAVDDFYNNMFITGAKRDARDVSKIIVSGVMFIRRRYKTPLSFRRQFSIAASALAERGLKVEDMGAQGEIPNPSYQCENTRHVHQSRPTQSHLHDAACRRNKGGASTDGKRTAMASIHAGRLWRKNYFKNGADKGFLCQ